METGGYKENFSNDDHARLAKILRSIKGKFLLSINDHPKVRLLYHGLPRLKVNVRYTISRDKSAQAQERTELVIANYPLPKQW